MPWIRFGTWALVATFAVGGVALAADALVESDEERIDDLIDAATQRAGDRRMDAVLSAIDPARVELTVADGRAVMRFGEDDADPSDAIRDTLAALESDDLEVVQRSIAVRDDPADVSLRVRSRGDVVDFQLGLARDGQSWLVQTIRRLR